MRWIAVAWFQRPLLAPWIHGQEDEKGLLLAPTFLLQALLGDPLPGVERASKPGDWLRTLSFSELPSGVQSGSAKCNF